MLGVMHLENALNPLLTEHSSLIVSSQQICSPNMEGWVPHKKLSNTRSYKMADCS